MIDGTYQANVETPIGVKQGTLTLQERDGVLTGTLHVLGSDTAIQNGRLEGNAIAFFGTLQVPFLGALPFTFSGEYADGAISGMAHTKMGDIVIEGSRV